MTLWRVWGPLKGSFIPGSPSPTWMQVTCCCWCRLDCQPQDDNLIKDVCFDLSTFSCSDELVDFSPFMLKRSHLVLKPGLWSASVLITARIHTALTRYLCPNRKTHRSCLPSGVPLSLRPFSVPPHHLCLPAALILLCFTAFLGSLLLLPCTHPPLWPLSYISSSITLSLVSPPTLPPSLPASLKR